MISKFKLLTYIIYADKAGFITPNCSEDTVRHETGHSVQSLMFGPLFHLVVSIPSIIRFCYRRSKGLDHEWYLSGWPEGNYRFGAEELGHTLRHIQKAYQKHIQKAQ